MVGSRLRTWLHRIGYVTTVIVIAEAAFVGYLAYNQWREREHRAAVGREHTRTHEGPLTDKDATETFAQALSLPDLTGDGFRFVAMPSFYRVWYVVAVHLPPGSEFAQGVVRIVAAPDAGNSPTKPASSAAPAQTFVIPKSDYTAIAKKLDSLIDGWPGDTHGYGCFDGTPVAFERVRGTRVTSGAGNESCSAHYHALNLEIRQMLKRYGPQDKITAGDDWMDDPAPAPSAAGARTSP